MQDNRDVSIGDIYSGSINRLFLYGYTCTIALCSFQYGIGLIWINLYRLSFKQWDVSLS